MVWMETKSEYENSFAPEAEWHMSQGSDADKDKKHICSRNNNNHNKKNTHTHTPSMRKNVKFAGFI